MKALFAISPEQQIRVAPVCNCRGGRAGARLWQTVSVLAISALVPTSVWIASAPGLGAAESSAQQINPIALQSSLKAASTRLGDAFGRIVAVSGDTIVVTAISEASGATGVNGDSNDRSVPNSGAAYAFVRDGTNWIQQAYLKASNTGADDQFGYSMALSGDIVVVGAPWEDSNATGIDGNQSDNSASNGGAAYVFVRNGTNWTRQAYLKASNTGANDTFGFNVAVSGDTIVVGAPFESSEATGVNRDQNNNMAVSSGAAYVFVRNGTNWTQQAYLKASNTGAGDAFGFKVAVSGDTIVVGAPYESSDATNVNGDQNNNNAYNSGAAYVFVRRGTNWSQQAYLKASNTEGGVPGGPYPTYYGDLFGWSGVVITGDTLVVGAKNEDSDATGVNGNQSNNNAVNSGAAYVFARRGTNWSQQAYLKASNTQLDDWFGFSLAASADTVVVGAIYEDSNATGVNGDQNDNSVSDSGAAYVFVRRGTNWAQQAYLKASTTRSTDVFGFSVAVSGSTIVAGAPPFSNADIFTGAGTGPQLAFGRDNGGGCVVRSVGHTGFSYRLERASSVTGPWSSILTNTAPASGLLEFRDTNAPPGPAFYRAVQP